MGKNPWPYLPKKMSVGMFLEGGRNWRWGRVGMLEIGGQRGRAENFSKVSFVLLFVFTGTVTVDTPI